MSPQWELFDVNFTSPSEGWAVGRDSFNHKGVLLHYQNGVWVSVPTPVVGSSWYLISVQFTSASEGWAVGVDDSIQISNEGVLLHFQNGFWTKASHPYVLPTWALNDVYFTSAQNGWAVGVGVQTQKEGIMLQWQNNGWNPFLPPNVATAWSSSALISRLLTRGGPWKRFLLSCDHGDPPPFLQQFVDACPFFSFQPERELVPLERLLSRGR